MNNEKNGAEQIGFDEPVNDMPYEELPNASTAKKNDFETEAIEL